MAVLVCIYDGCEVVGDFGDLEEHVVRVHGASPPVSYPCNFVTDGRVCTKKFGSLVQRRTHRKNKHGVG